MDPAVFDDALILTGPTASGKSMVGLLISERLDAEIISMDSMALYRGMDVGTAKPSLEDRARIPHHLIDELDPWQASSLAWWLREAAKCCEGIRARGRQILFVGGTPLYLKGLLHGIFEGPEAEPEMRRRLEQETGASLHARLSQVDPVTAKKLHPNDMRRMVRALEVLELTGKPISAWQQQFDQVRPRQRLPLWLDWPRTILYDRINSRVVQMITNGLLDEARRLRQLPLPLSKEARQAAGYKEAYEHLEGKISLDEMTDQIQTRSRQLAKRQLTWFRNWRECRPLPVAPAESAADIATRAIEIWFAKGDRK